MKSLKVISLLALGLLGTTKAIKTHDYTERNETFVQATTTSTISQFSRPIASIPIPTSVTPKFPSANQGNGTYGNTTFGTTSLNGTFVKVTCFAGSIIGNSSDGVDSFLGIPYALPPADKNRLRSPVRIVNELKNFDGTKLAKSCPQGNLMGFLKTGSLNKRMSAVQYVAAEQSSRWADSSSSEDCLSVVIQRPTGTKAGAKLPVLYWIHGGGFLIGSNSKYDASGFIKAGVNGSQPFIFVAVNYRLGGWGFLPGLQSRDANATNLGLQDQRMGLEWVADNIEAFGGDPSKVTIWGESAGAISVFDHLVLDDGDANYKGKGLFRGAIMDSGSMVPADPVASHKGEEVLSKVLVAGGCNSTDDPILCLRGLSAAEFSKAVNVLPGIISYQSLALSYLPRPDNVSLKASPDVLAQSGKIFPVPMIMGNQEDEGTLFTQTQKDMGSTDIIVDYLYTYYFFGATKRQLRELVYTYSEDPAEGSPFRTGQEFNDYPGKKRLAAMLGDLVFTLSRRLASEIVRKTKPDLPVWSYMSSYRYRDGFNSFLGTAHGTDLDVLFTGDPNSSPTKSGRAYYLNFLYHLDPNIGSAGLTEWPQWTPESPQMLWFNKTNNGLLADTFRNGSYQWIKDNAKLLYI